MAQGIALSMNGRPTSPPFSEPLTVEQMIARARVAARWFGRCGSLQLVEVDEHGTLLRVVWDSRDDR